MTANDEVPPRSIAWNGFWTVAMSASTGLVAVILPPFLARLLTHEEYGAWALALQVASYVLVLGFGLQGAVGRFVALARGAAAADDAARNGVVVAAFHMTGAAALAGVVLVAAASAFLPYFLSEMSPGVAAGFRVALLLCGASAALSLTGTPFTGAFLGDQRAHVPALIVLVGRGVQVVLLVTAALRYRTLEALAVAYCAAQVLILLAQFVAWRGGAHRARLLWRRARADHYRELARFCAPFVLWNVLAALSFGSDLVIVSKVDFAATPYYAVSLTIATTFIGLLAAGYNSLVPAAARHVGANDRDALFAMLLRGGRVGVGVSIALAVPLVFAATGPLSLWVGATYATAATPYVALLIVAQVVRLSMSMYGNVTIAAGLHRAVVLAPVLDAAVCLGLGIGLGLAMGAEGVAIGMIAGAAVNAAAWYLKDPLRDVFGGRRVARAFVGACVPAVATSAAGLLLAASALAALGVLDEPWARLAGSLCVSAVVAIVAVRKPARAPEPRDGLPDHGSRLRSAGDV